MRGILLVGGGGHCRSCIDVIEAEARYTIIGVVQPELNEEGAVFGYPIVGVDADLPALLKETEQALVTVGQITSPMIRMRLFQQLQQLDAKLPIIISPNAYCSPRATIQQGSIMMHGSVVNTGAKVGKNCIINSQALLEHDVTIEANCHISTGARVNGDVTIGEGTFVGSGVILREGVKIGKKVVIGAGQTILSDVPDHTIVRSSDD